MAARSKATLSLDLPPGTNPSQLVALINDRLRQLSQAVSDLQGANGPVKLLDSLDMQGHSINDLADAEAGGDAVSRSYGDRRYLGAAQAAGAVKTSSTAAAPPTVAAVTSPRQLELTVPGTLGIGSNQAALVELAAAATPASMVALVKQAPSGADLTAQVNVGGTSWQQIVVKNGQTTATIGSGLGAIAANALVTIDLVGVGTTFPGADLTVLIRFG